MLCLFLLFVSLLSCLPLGKLPLSLLALEKRLYLREQDTGQGLDLMVRDSCAVAVGFLLPWHGTTPLKLPLAEQIALEHCSVPGDEAALASLGI